MPITTMEDFFDPEVLGPMVENGYQQAMAFMPLADVDRTLEGKPGSTLTVPTWGHIGAAEDVAEGADIPVEKLGQGFTKATVSKFGKGVGFTDESDLISMGNTVAQATKQISEVIAQGADSKLMDKALEVKNTAKVTADIDGLDLIQSFFDTDVKSPAYTLIMSPKTRLKINKAVREYTKGSDTGANLAINGAFSTALGMSIYVTKKMADDKIVAIFSTDVDIAKAKEMQEKMKSGDLSDKELQTLNSGRPFKWLVKRDILVETDRNKKNQTNYIYGTQIAAPYVQNPSKILVADVTAKDNEIVSHFDDDATATTTDTKSTAKKSTATTK